MLGMQVQAKVTSKGQITIPQAVRRALRLQTGDVVIFDVDEQGVRMRPHHATHAFSRYAGALRHGQGQTLDQVVKEVRALRGHPDA
jgi:AbrB family looped-hinge helix DNA binding protein